MGKNENEIKHIFAAIGRVAY